MRGKERERIEVQNKYKIPSKLCRKYVTAKGNEKHRCN